MDSIHTLNTEITKLKANYQREIDRQKSECYTVIEIATQTLRTKLELLNREKERLFEQKTVFEIQYRSRVRGLVTEDQINFNLSLISKILIKDKELKDLPENLHSLVNIYARIQKCNQEVIEAQRDFKIIEDEQLIKEKNIIPTLTPPYQTRLIDLLQQLKEAVEQELEEVKSS